MAVRSRNVWSPRLVVQNLFQQVIQHETMAAGEGGHKLRGVPLSLHRQRRQLQPSNPALGARFQRGNVFRGQVQAHDRVEKFNRFGGGEAQVSGPQFGDLVARAGGPGAAAGPPGWQ